MWGMCAGDGREGDRRRVMDSTDAGEKVDSPVIVVDGWWTGMEALRVELTKPRALGPTVIVVGSVREAERLAARIREG